MLACVVGLVGLVASSLHAVASVTQSRALKM
jgi:hypothetical protein